MEIGLGEVVSKGQLGRRRVKNSEMFDLLRKVQGLYQSFEDAHRCASAL